MNIYFRFTAVLAIACYYWYKVGYKKGVLLVKKQIINDPLWSAKYHILKELREVYMRQKGFVQNSYTKKYTENLKTCLHRDLKLVESGVISFNHALHPKTIHYCNFTDYVLRWNEIPEEERKKLIPELNIFEMEVVKKGK